MKTLKYLSIAALITAAISSCKKEDVTPHDHHHGTLMLQFENKVGANPLVLNSTKYTNNTDTFTVSTFNYYISNVILTATDNTIYSETDSYHLVKADEAGSLHIILEDVPLKSYSSITFMIGVDSLKNVSGAQSGALDPSNGHFWSWNSGYIMAKLEGNSPQSTATGNKILFHVGGFMGANNAIKTVNLPLSTSANVSESISPEVFIKADLAEWFAPNAIKFATTNTIHMPGVPAKMIADNYANMFSVTKVVN